MVFSTKTLIESTNNQLFNKQEKSLNINRSFFLESLELISEDQKIFRALMSNYYSNNIINEGSVSDLLKLMIKKIDVKKIILNIIKGFMDILDKLWNRFNAFMLDYLGKNNVIKHYKSKLEKLNEPVEYGESRFIFTNLGSSISYTSFKNELDKEYSSLILSLAKLHDFKNYEQLFSDIENIKNDIDMSEDYYNEVRGNIVGERNPIMKSEFPEALFKYFRNGGDPLPSGLITSSEIKYACSEYFDFNKKIKMIQKDKSDLKSAASKLQKDVMNINLENYIKDNIPSEAQNVFVKVLENKSKRIKETCELYLHVLSIKMDSVKEAYMQYTKILMTASKHIAREGL